MLDQGAWKNVGKQFFNMLKCHKLKSHIPETAWYQLSLLSARLGLSCKEIPATIRSAVF